MNDIRWTDNKSRNNYSIINKIKNELDNNQNDYEDDSMASDKVFNPNQATKTNGLNQEADNTAMHSGHLPEKNSVPEDVNAVQKNTSTENNLDYSLTKRKIIESISEEIASHLKVVLSYADELKHYPLPSEAIKIVQRIIDKSNFIINSLKAQSEIYNGELSLNSQVIYATTVFDDILNLLSGYTEFRGIRLSRKFEGDASIFVDKNMLYQACLDIIKFLCENMLSKGEIAALLTRTKDTIILIFQASGIKISDDFFKNVFEPELSNYKSTLIHARKIIRAHNGAIKVGKSDESAPEIMLEMPIVR